jgi:hypothetical protein
MNNNNSKMAMASAKWRNGNNGSEMKKRKHRNVSAIMAKYQ